MMNPFINNGPMGMVPTNNPNDGLTMNFLGDITIVQHHELGGPANMMNAQMQQFSNCMGIMMNMQQNALAIEQQKINLEKQKLVLASDIISGNCIDSNNSSKLIENNKADPKLSKQLNYKLLADDVEYKIVDETKDRPKPFKMKTINGFNDEKGFNDLLNDDEMWSTVVEEVNAPGWTKSIYKTLNKISDDEVIADLTKQKNDHKSPKLFSNKDGESVVVAFILLDENLNWRNSAKRSILNANKIIVPNFFKEDQEYLFFLYENNTSIKANSAVFITPTTINAFLSLGKDYSYLKEYDKQLLFDACNKYTDEVFRIVEPIVPSSSNITKLFRGDDYKYSWVTINPLYSKSIQKIDISANLAARTTIKIN